MKLLPGLSPELAKCAPGGSEDFLVFRPDERRGRQQHDVRGFDKSLRHSAMSVLKSAKHESLKVQVSALFIEDTLTDAAEQGRTCGVTQGGVIRPSQYFGGHQDLEAQFQTR